MEQDTDGNTIPPGWEITDALVSTDSVKGCVELTLGNSQWQLTPASAQALGAALLRCAAELMVRAPKPAGIDAPANSERVM